MKEKLLSLTLKTVPCHSHLTNLLSLHPFSLHEMIFNSKCEVMRVIAVILSVCPSACYTIFSSFGRLLAKMFSSLYSLVINVAMIFVTVNYSQ